MSLPTLLELLRLATGYLREKGVEQPRLDAEVLLAHVLKTERIMLYVHHDRPLEPEEVTAYRALVARRGRREPAPYLTGEKEFHGLPFRVTPAVLVPRPETEHLVAVALAFAGDGAWHGFDVGTGSGVLAVTLAVRCPQARLVASDLSPEALAVARENAQRHGVDDRVELVEGDLWAGREPRGAWDLVISNPPYLTAQEMAGLPPEVRWEPQLALDGGPDGLAVIRRLAAEAWAHLRPGGLLAFEIGASQAAACLELLENTGHYRDARVTHDHAGLPRVVSCLRAA
ncbi:peptide chain release factor N(5)-glutamine methyltransferase [Limnochorda pilosa]|uniref:Release factor glutamine methyltransferase n=1 Tax=Limnochorda pilosa TaxID=1555112 RepID=A0A0K2SQ18_LIMPI|nr:peptide chain release factor N(5)-glutamine methyltransferase [Limnochorda pilosa]BAS28929.1 restriction endonuclease subunit M [Limnochorda pilosa]